MIHGNCADAAVAVMFDGADGKENVVMFHGTAVAVMFAVMFDGRRRRWFLRFARLRRWQRK